MITDVGIDMDGVLYPFVPAFKHYCEVRMQKFDLPDPTHWYFYEDWGMDEKQFNEWLKDACRTDRVFAWMPPAPDAVASFKKLRNMGVKIHILTHRITDSWAQTAEWLEKYDLVPDSLHFGPNKNILKEIATDECAILDDHIPFIQSAEQAGIKAYVLKHPWNEGHSDLQYVHSIYDFASHIAEYNKIKLFKTLPQSQFGYPFEGVEQPKNFQMQKYQKLLNDLYKQGHYTIDIKKYRDQQYPWGQNEY